MQTAIEIRNAILSGEITAEEVTLKTLENIKINDGQIGAFLEVFSEEALQTAKEIDKKIKDGVEVGRLAGVPVAIKDNILYKGKVTSAGSRMLEEYIASYDSTVVHRLKEAGAIIVGRTNMDEFGMGSSTETSFYKKTKNPVDTSKVPGGSSGGSAAAVAAGFVPLAFGSDTGGSIRQPASLCGVVGLKTSYGRVSRYGLIALASSLDQIGPIAHTVEDAALALEIVEGKDSADATTVDAGEKQIAELLDTDLLGVKIGRVKNVYSDEMDSEVKARIDEAIDKMKQAGAEIIDVELPLLEYALPAYYIIQPAEASSNLARFDGIRYGSRAQTQDLWESYRMARGIGFGDEVKRRIILGTYILSAGYYDAFYKKALAVRTAIHSEIEESLKKVDVLVMPTSPCVAWNSGEKFDDPVAMYLADVYTVIANIASVPAISVPAGSAHGLPVGLQFIAGYLEEGKMLNIAAAYQKLK
ncbi:Asp-tRNA(Asn)/Glu-tRNA(Gln) amidotransferase subunit GatA [Patescibacteria group bacterium]|nr:Asp-tRNA(Asn)/Glu-tRNA(Gln) amidotransferase subunit GatA [Patescibacteria group bacterium]